MRAAGGNQKPACRRCWDAVFERFEAPLSRAAAVVVAVSQIATGVATQTITLAVIPRDLACAWAAMGIHSVSTKKFQGGGT
ncbi:hypothetical protein ABAC460_09875 [Asticcacaulis sp. AC460]|nr:hypothetical protein ABAC460_09875 [Asticcacaulis sp. AC460]